MHKTTQQSGLKRRILLIGLVYIMHLGCNSAENSKSGLSVKKIETESIAPISIGDIYNKQKYIDSMN